MTPIVLKRSKKFYLLSFFSFRYSMRSIRCGLHSGFRICDIFFFETFWKLFSFHDLYIKNDVKYPWTRRYFAWINERMGKCEYVACPFCVIFKAKPVTVKKCGCELAIILEKRNDTHHLV